MKKPVLYLLMAVWMLTLAPAALAQDSAGTAGGGAVESVDLPAPATAAPAAASQAARSEPSLGIAGAPSLGIDLLKGLGAFILVLILLYLTLKALGRMSRFKGGKGRASFFQLRGIQSFDSRKYLAAVEVDGRLLVVGVTQDRIVPVAHWFLEDEDQEGLEFTTPVRPVRDGGEDFVLPDLDDLPEPPDISIADSNRGPKK